MSSGPQFITVLTIGHCMRGVNPSITSGMETSRVRITWGYLKGNKNIFTGTGEGPRATSCAFWNEFMPMLRKENRTGDFFKKFKPLLQIFYFSNHQM